MENAGLYALAPTLIVLLAGLIDCVRPNGGSLPGTVVSVCAFLLIALLVQYVAMHPAGAYDPAGPAFFSGADARMRDLYAYGAMVACASNLAAALWCAWRMTDARKTGRTAGSVPAMLVSALFAGLIPAAIWAASADFLV